MNTRESTLRTIEEIAAWKSTSHLAWSNYVNSYVSYELPAASITIIDLPTQTPAYLGDQDATEQIVKRFEEGGSLWVEGVSSWSGSTGFCSLKDKEVLHKLLLGISSKRALHFSSDGRFQDWPGVDGVESPKHGNSIAIMIMAWSYILSAKWAELQSKGPNTARLEYTTPQSLHCSGVQGPETIILDLGETCQDTIYWWRAVLAHRNAWHAFIRHGTRTFQSPWSAQFANDETFIVRGSFDGEFKDLSDLQAPGSQVALDYLAQFCAQNDTYGQCIAALSAVLFFPYTTNVVRTLPKPKLSHPPSARRLEQRHVAIAVQQQYNYLPYYLSLSSNTRSVRALLAGYFFEPTVSCNLASPWLHGAFDVLNKIIQGKEYCTLVGLMSNRQARLSGLWLGASLLGLVEHFWRLICAGLQTVDMLSAAWTGTVHSFMGPKISDRSRAIDRSISRADECRLLYLAGSDSHPNVPLCPFKPFGFTDLSRSDLEVKAHAMCGDVHQLEYRYWRWILNDGYSTPDPGRRQDGFDPQLSFVMPESSIAFTSYATSLNNEDASENATRSIFGWLRPDGHSKTEEEIFRDLWFEPMFEDEDEAEEEAEDEVQETDYSQEDFATSDKYNRIQRTRLQEWLTIAQAS